MYPKLSEIRELEGSTLKAISEIGEFAKLGELQIAARAAQKQFNAIKGTIDIHLGFSLDMRLRGDKASKLLKRRVDIGARIEPDTSNKSIKNASYSLLICKSNNPATSPIVRKMHFDYEPVAHRNHKEPKPSVHMQICGKLSSHHISAGYAETRLAAMYPRFEKPRIPMAPVSTALLVNWLLLEFQSDAAAQPILKNDRWHKLVRETERKVLLPYFKDGADYLVSGKYADKRFLQSHLYEMAE